MVDLYFPCIPATIWTRAGPSRRIIVDPCMEYASATSYVYNLLLRIFTFHHSVGSPSRAHSGLLSRLLVRTSSEIPATGVTISDLCKEPDFNQRMWLQGSCDPQTLTTHHQRHYSCRKLYVGNSMADVISHQSIYNRISLKPSNTSSSLYKIQIWFHE